MTWFPREHGPQPLPPGELLRLRDEVTSAPRAEVRHRHVAAAATEARLGHGNAAHAAQVLARRGARVIATVAGIIVVTSGLAGAEILPEPARALTAAVTERLVPDDPEPAPAEVPVTGDVPADAGPSTTEQPPRAAIAAAEADGLPPAPTVQPEPAPTSSTTSTTVAETTSTTVAETTSTTVAETTTTTTSSTTTTSTTAPSTTTSTTVAKEKTAPPPAPAFGKGDPDPGGAG